MKVDEEMNEESVKIVVVGWIFHLVHASSGENRGKKFGKQYLSLVTNSELHLKALCLHFTKPHVYCNSSLWILMILSNLNLFLDRSCHHF